ncbi:hypothetical protein CVT26_009807 [Gymnopilus dilepis]|uniref:Alcohol acetyltransferase n=1 Tax=Gymnopilus dilepis TaxID=231916 RepID=A0A409YI91_9AGAR|nr:hypothetical protein CVT26_009807 [Gymnopilus dilepis]
MSSATVVEEVLNRSLGDLSLNGHAPQTCALQIERQLGETEVSYFLPSREDGVNDMYLHLGVRAPSDLVHRQRVCFVWAILRLRHPLLASAVRMKDYSDIAFLYCAPSSPAEALRSADLCLEYKALSKNDLIDSYLNGPRTLSNDRLSYLIVSSDDPSQGMEKNFDFLICATHFLGDGMALHQFANDFFTLLGGPSSIEDLQTKLSMEWQSRVQKKPPTLPSPMEDRLPLIASQGFGPVVARVDFQETQRKLIGGHAFPRKSRGPRHTIVPTISFGPEETRKMLVNSKRRGVSISSALFAICNMAWARTHPSNWDLPMMMYSALNMRPNLTADKALNDSYWFLAIGYFNVVLPSFIPQHGDVSRSFWHRAHSAKMQSAKAAKSPLNVTRCREMAKERGQRARIWAKEDDDKAMGISPQLSTAVPAPSAPPKPKVPSAALMGLSLLGNLDGIYKHSTFPNIKLHTLTTGSRQRAGGMLLFGYTFVEKLWVSLGYDENNFEKEAIENFWHNVNSAINEFLLT